MSFKWGLVAFLLMAIHYSITEGAASRSKQCTYPGYKPGGFVPKITSISVKEPRQFEENMLENVLGIGEKGGEVIEKVLELGKASPQLAVAFGAIALAMGIAQGEDPSPNDILERAHESIKLLADDVDERIAQLQDYADAKDLQMEGRLMHNNYKELFDKWQECVRYRTREESDACQVRVESAIKSSRYHFQQLQEMFEGKNSNGKQLYDPNFTYRYVGTWQWMKANEGQHVWFPSYDEVKRLEIGLIPFRNFATLHLIVMETLVKTYEAEGQISCESYKQYLERLTKWSKYYVRYVKWAYEWIYIRQYEENMFFGIPNRATGRPESSPAEGFVGTRKCSGSTCAVECSQFIKDNKCTYRNGPVQQTSDEAAQICETYLSQAKEQLSSFWQKEVLNVAKIWEKYTQEAEKRMAANKCG